VILLPFLLTILITCVDFICSSTGFFSHVDLLSGLNETGTIHVSTDDNGWFRKEVTNIVNNVMKFHPVYEVLLLGVWNSTFGSRVWRRDENVAHLGYDKTGRSVGWMIAADLAGYCPPPISVWQEIFLEAVSPPASRGEINIGGVHNVLQDKYSEMKKRLRRFLGIFLGVRIANRDLDDVSIRARRRYNFLQKMSSPMISIVAYLSRLLATPSVFGFGPALVVYVIRRALCEWCENRNAYEWDREHHLPWANAWFGLRALGLIMLDGGAIAICAGSTLSWICWDGEDSSEYLQLAVSSWIVLGGGVLSVVMSFGVSCLGSMLEEWAYGRWIEETAEGEAWKWSMEQDGLEGELELPFWGRVRAKLTVCLRPLWNQKRSETELLLIWGGRVTLRRVETSDEMCEICWGEYENGEFIAEFPCGHEFHEMCAEDWANIHRCCPKCRAGLAT
jgi:hypothetical protein